MFDLTGKTALVTGASGGIGGAIARDCAAAGWHIAVHYRSHRDAAEKVLADVRSAGSDGVLGQADVRRSDQVTTLFEELRAWGPLDAMVYCAGVSSSRLLLRVADADWQEVLDVNLTGAFHCLRAVGSQMVERRRGSIVVIGSYAGSQGAAGQSAYAASKAALIGLVRSAACEWGAARVRLNLILPGWHATALSGDAMPDAGGFDDHLLAAPPSLPDVARAVRQLLELPGASGQVWNLDSRIL